MIVAARICVKNSANGIKATLLTLLPKTVLSVRSIKSCVKFKKPEIDYEKIVHIRSVTFLRSIINNSTSQPFHFQKQAETRKQHNARNGKAIISPNQ